MINLPLVKRWTGDGYGDASARLLTQVKRTATVALYERLVEKDKRPEGYEVFIIKMRHKGDALPGGLVEQEDREVYPSAGSFGFSAYHIYGLTNAQVKFDELVERERVKEATPISERRGRKKKVTVDA